MPPERIVLKNKLSSFSDRWGPKIIADVNDHQAKLVKLLGEFVWHKHESEDEMFLVLKGAFVMRFRDGDVQLMEGEAIVVPRGVEHQPFAEAECHVLLFEPSSTLNTGNVKDGKTVARPEHI